MKHSISIFLIILLTFGICRADCDSVVVAKRNSNGDNGPYSGISYEHYNYNGILKSYENSATDPYGGVSANSYSTVFDANENLTEEHWFYNGMNSRRCLYTYDGIGNLIKKLTQSYNNGWFGGDTDSMSYNLQNQLTDSAHYSSTSGDRYSFFYNVSGLDSIHIHQVFAVATQWTNLQRTDFYYDINDVKNLTVSFSWNSTVWDTTSTSMYAYNNLLLDTIYTSTPTPSWAIRDLTTYEYGSLNKLIYTFTMHWADTAWVYVAEDIHEVDVNGYPTHDEYAVANYNINGNLYWDNYGGYSNSTYDAQGHLLHDDGRLIAGGPFSDDYHYNGDVLISYDFVSGTMGTTTYGTITYTYADIHGDSVFCAGSSTTIWADSCTGHTYLWSTGETTPSIVVSTAGVYTVTVDHGNGFVATSLPYNLSFITGSPYIPTSTDSTHNVCSSVGFYLSVPSLQNVEYQWFRNDSLLVGSVSSNISSTWANCVSGNYYLVATNVCGSDTSSATYVNPIPIQTTPQITASGPLSFCVGDSVTLTCSTATSYLWFQGASTSAAITVAATSNYTVRAYDQYGCFLTASAQVNVSSTVAPIHLTFNSGFIASGSGATYKQWFLDGDTIPSQTGANFLPLVVGWYSMAAANTYPCISYSDSIYVDPATLNVDAGQDVYACHDSTIIIGAYNATFGGTAPFSYDWGNDPNLVSFGNGRAQLSNVTQDTSYYLTVTDANGIVKTDSMHVYADRPHIPTVGLQYVTGICPASSNLIVINNAGEPFTFKHWYLNGVLQTNASSYYTVNLPGIYSAAILDQHGCPVMSENDTVHAYPSRPTPVIHAILDTNVCVSGTGTLWVPYHYNNTYVWSRSLYPSVYDTIYHSAYAATYYMMETDTNGCAYNTSIQFNASQGLINMDIISTTWHSLCWNDTITLNAAVFAGWTYSWTLDGSDIYLNTPAINVTQGGIYVCTAISPQGCMAKGEYVLYEYAQPAFTITNNSGTLVATSINYMSYQWFLNGQEIPYVFTNEYTPTVAGNYIVRVFNMYGCETYSNTLYFGFCSVSINTGIQSRVCVNSCTGELTANATGISPVTYSWSIGSSIPTISALCAGTYWVTITDSAGCQATDTAEVTTDTLSVSTVFTPPSCPTCADGVIVATGHNGIPAYTYTINYPLAILTGSSFSGLPNGNYQVCVTDVLGCMSCTDDTLSTGVNGINSTQQAIVFPNPLTNEFIVKGYDFTQSKFVLMTIYDSSGKEVMQINSAHDRFNVEGLTPGVYSIKLLCEKDVIYFRFVKE